MVTPSVTGNASNIILINSIFLYGFCYLEIRYRSVRYFQLSTIAYITVPYKAAKISRFRQSHFEYALRSFQIFDLCLLDNQT